MKTDAVLTRAAEVNEETVNKFTDSGYPSMLIVHLWVESENLDSQDEKKLIEVSILTKNRKKANYSLCCQ